MRERGKEIVGDGFREKGCGFKVERERERGVKELREQSLGVTITWVKVAIIIFLQGFRT